MRDLPTSLQAKLDSGSTTLARCWRVTRRDGQSMGFTDHDRDLTFDGTVFEAASGLSAGALQQTTGLNVDNSEALGALQAAGLTEADIVAGRYDGAAISHWLVDWSDPADRVLVFRGTLGEITRGSVAFETELRGLSEDLNRPVGRVYLRDCDAVVGDARCTVDLSNPAFLGTGAVVGVTQRRRLEVSGLSGFDIGWFSTGRLEWLTGANAGQVARVKRDVELANARELKLWEEPPFAITSGDTFRVTAGCDRRAETCRVKFSNFNNFRGFPHLPGEDWATAYVAKGERHDGGSLYR